MPKRSKKGQDLIFAAAVLIGAVILAMVIYTAISSHSTANDVSGEPPLSANHEETVHVGSSISPAQLSQCEREEAATACNASKGEIKWRARGAARPAEKMLSTYEQDKKVVKPADKGNNGVM
jgi:hypothetical protein